MAQIREHAQLNSRYCILLFLVAGSEQSCAMTLAMTIVSSCPKSLLLHVGVRNHMKPGMLSTRQLVLL